MYCISPCYCQMQQLQERDRYILSKSRNRQLLPIEVSPTWQSRQNNSQCDTACPCVDTYKMSDVPLPLVFVCDGYGKC